MHEDDREAGEALEDVARIHPALDRLRDLITSATALDLKASAEGYWTKGTTTASGPRSRREVARTSPSGRLAHVPEAARHLLQLGPGGHAVLDRLVGQAGGHGPLRPQVAPPRPIGRSGERPRRGGVGHVGEAGVEGPAQQPAAGVAARRRCGR